MSFPLLFPLLWWSAASYAGDAVPAAGTPTPAATTPGAGAPLAGQAEVAAYVASVRRESGGPVLLAAAGPDAEHLALKVASAMPPGHVRVLRVGYIGDAPEEIRRALDTAGMRCAVRLAPTSAGTWLVSTHGECTPAVKPAAPVAAQAPEAAHPVAAPPVAAPPVATAVPSPAAPVAPVTTAPTTTTAPAAATAAPVTTAPATAAPGSTIPGLGTALPGVRVESAPASPVPDAAVPYLTPPPPPPDPEVLAATYKLVELRRVPNPRPREDLPDATWAVRDGRGRTLGALDFARRTGDLATERRIDREGKTARAVGLGLALGGGALVVAGLGVVVAREAGAPQWGDYEPDGSDYTNEEYFEALAQAEADFRAAEEVHSIQADDRVWIAGFMMGAGTLAAITSPLAMRGVTDRQRIPALYWDEEDADALIDGHNAAVRQRIGIPEPVSAVPLVVTPPPAAEEGDDEDDEPRLDEDPPEDARPGGPDEGPDDPGPKLAPGGPSGHYAPASEPAPVFLSPYFGLAPGSGADGSSPVFGVAGLSGSF